MRSNDRRFGTLLATVSGNLFLVLGSLFFGGIATLFGWLPPRGNITFWCARAWSHGLLWASGVHIKKEFAEPLSPGPFIFMANHRSTFDIPALIATLPGQTRFLAKRSLFKIPIFGWALWLGGFVPVDRGNRSRARTTMRAAADRLRAGKSILIFPEETRSLDGQMLPFKSGGFLLARESGLAVVPVGIRGTRNVEGPGSLIIHPGEVAVRYGKPKKASGLPLGAKRRFLNELRDGIAELVGPEG